MRNLTHNIVLFLRVEAGKKPLRVVRGDGKGTELVSGETVPADLREG
jgi:hypothetical protein